jgi:hypothetical protein
MFPTEFVPIVLQDIPETTGRLKHQTVKTVAARMVVKFTADGENFLPGVPPINFAAGLIYSLVLLTADLATHL